MTMVVSAGNHTEGSLADRLRHRAILLAWLTIGWNVIESVVSLYAGAKAGSSALIGFGIDAAIEFSSAAIVIWQLRSDAAVERERLALRLIAVSFFALGFWVIGSSVADLLERSVPEPSPLGIAIAALSLVVMPAIAVAKQRVGTAMGSASVLADGAQTWLCTALSAILLLGLGANAVFGWWWADPVAGLVIGAMAFREGRDAWNGDNCCAPIVPGSTGCDIDRSNESDRHGRRVHDEHEV